MDGCEDNLVIPHELTDENQNTKKVEVIGQYAFYFCGYGKTHSIVLSRYIKVIKTCGFGGMFDVANFRVEEESCLERIEENGLTHLRYLNSNVGDRTDVLVLSSTVTYIAKNGLFYNNPFKTIYYCGSTHLSNHCDLELGGNQADIKVTSLYTHATIFGSYRPNKDKESIADAEEICKSYGFKLEASPSLSPLPSPSPSPPPTPPTEEGRIPSRHLKFISATYLIASHP